MPSLRRVLAAHKPTIEAQIVGLKPGQRVGAAGEAQALETGKKKRPRFRGRSS
jgi:hypothetical protein